MGNVYGTKMCAAMNFMVDGLGGEVNLWPDLTVGDLLNERVYSHTINPVEEMETIIESEIRSDNTMKLSFNGVIKALGKFPI